MIIAIVTHSEGGLHTDHSAVITNILADFSEARFCKLADAPACNRWYVLLQQGCLLCNV